MSRILFIEDDVVDQMAFKRFAAAKGFPHEYTMVGSAEEARKALRSEPFDFVVCDYLLGDGTAFDILDLRLDIPVVVITGAGSEEVAVRAMKSGAHDYLIKDREHNFLKVLPLTIEKAIKQRRTEERVNIQSVKESAEAVIVGGSGGLSATLKLVDLASSSGSPVLITGETGTGKNLIAKAIHYRSFAWKEPFVGVNCLSLPENLIEAELFGYEKGAFTGAVAGRRGLFEMAERGTIFLDEIGDMPLHLQGKLLSVIDDRMIKRLGGELIRPVNVRVIAATNVDIENSLGITFRKDLYYRLSIIRIHIPPLRERSGDIPEICRHMLKELTGRKDTNLSDSEMRRLMAYPWPGNVRELRNVLERAVLLQKGAELRPSELLRTEINEDCACEESESPASEAFGGDRFKTLVELEMEHIRAALRKYSGNRMKTAEALGISLATLKRRLKEMGQSEPLGSK